MPDRSLSATRLAAKLQGSLTVALATVTAAGEPRVAPINALFIRGRFYVPTIRGAARARHLARRPAVSLSYFEGETLAVIVHGQARAIGTEDAEFAALDQTQVDCGNKSVTGWGEGIYLEVEPEVIYTFEAKT